MNLSLVRELMRKDLQDLRRNRYVLYSMLFLPILLSAISIIATTSLAQTLSQQPATAERVLPIFPSLMVMIPAIITTLVGSTSVILEKNNHSLEPLLGTPISDTELFAGKAAAPFIPGLLIAWLAFGIYIGVTDLLTYGKLGYLLFPSTLTYIQIFFLTPVVSMLGTFAALFISSKMKDVRAAQQVSSLVVLPILLLVYLPLFAAGVDILINLTVGAVLLCVALVMFSVSVKVFRRETILIAWGK